jgi:hypothetical protein
VAKAGNADRAGNVVKAANVAKAGNVPRAGNVGRRRAAARTGTVIGVSRAAVARPGVTAVANRHLVVGTTTTETVTRGVAARARGVDGD